jgi:murein DD-endopeptidase MepM/ murein hydrolase activator NlpD
MATIKSAANTKRSGYRMISINRFMTLPEYCRKVPTNLLRPLLAILPLLFFAFFASLSCTPAPLLAAEKAKAEPTKSAEKFLANAEQMIEQLILQIDRQNGSEEDGIGLSENLNPTPYVSSVPNIKPVSGLITSTFGMRLHPIYNLSLFHQGIDISAAEGTNVQTTGDGIVAFAGYDKGYGQKITINHGYGYKTSYAHLSTLLVHQGQKVSRGNTIAQSGNTGITTGPHLHYEIQKNNIKVNPTAYFYDETNPDKLITIQNASPKQEDNHS